ncbi:MAG: hypothetical protein WEB00_01080 [Dehalococcoidia bacterium]
MERLWPSSIGCYNGPPPDDGYDSSNIKEWIRLNWGAHIEERWRRGALRQVAEELGLTLVPE